MLSTPRKSLSTFAAIGALALCSTLSLAAPARAAEPGIIAGTVVDKWDARVPDADVTLIAPTGRYHTHTNSKGEFAIVGVFCDTYTLTVEKAGLIAISASGIEVADDQITDLGAIAIQ
jgi:hypothetical protein